MNARFSTSTDSATLTQELVGDRKATPGSRHTWTARLFTDAVEIQVVVGLVGHRDDEIHVHIVSQRGLFFHVIQREGVIWIQMEAVDGQEDRGFLARCEVPFTVSVERVLVGGLRTEHCTTGGNQGHTTLCNTNNSHNH